MAKKHPFLIEKFFKYCSEQGMELLPDDMSFLRRLTRFTPESKIRPILSKYVIIWTDEMAKESIEHKKQNTGRFAANSWIREYLT